MDVSTFLSLLCGFATLSGIITEIVKQFFKHKEGTSYNLIAIIVGLIVGISGAYVYFSLSNTQLTDSFIIISILMGIGTALSSMVGYDKIKQLILQLTGK